MASTLNASTTLGLVNSADTSGVLALQSNGSTSLTLDTNLNVGVGTTTPTNYAPYGYGRTVEASGGYSGSFLVSSSGQTYKGGMKLYGATGDTIIGSISSNKLHFTTADSAPQVTLDTSGNLGLGVTPSAWSTSFSAKAFQFGPVGSLMSLQASSTNNQTFMSSNVVNLSGGWTYMNTDSATYYRQYAGTHAWFNAPSGTAGTVASFTQAMTLDASGNLLVGTTTGLYSARITASTSASCASLITTTSAEYSLVALNQGTSGNNGFVIFQTENSPVTRGSITYNRGAGLVAYNVTSDYRAKDISGPVTDSGALIDSVPVYMGTMKGATQERPMFIAHETPSYAHIGKKDAVDENGNPVYQQMDASALIPVMWAEIQSLRQRLAAANL